MTADVPFFDDLITQLKLEEGCKLRAYRDQFGYWTCGYGSRFLPDGSPVTAVTTFTIDEATTLLKQKALSIGRKLELDLPWVAKLDNVRRLVLWEMAYQLGDAGLEAFHTTLGDVKAGNYSKAANDMLQSLWAKQTHARACRMAARMASGV